MKYLQRKRKERLFKQWVALGDLSPEEVPSDVLVEQSAEEAELAAECVSREGIPRYTASIDRGMVRLPIRYVFLGLAVIAALLIALSVVVTVLIMRS